jgi:enamine deaminase RidA (YjgF/YER057c/UK114 family)
MPLEHFNPENVYQPYENVYTQVIRSTGGVQIHVAGTVPFSPGRIFVGEGDMATQVKQIFKNLRLSLEAAGATIADVVRITIYTTNVDLYLEVGTPLAKEFWGSKPPVSTLVGTPRLADPRYLVEIEATAIID